ncbi:hypothetical protein FIB47_10725 [Lactococcus cremoris]|uniref:hypothetical protein n=1 Tax=Lactococcus lactis subsp. cremoris TaxID=1359 RepID=UPI000517D97F|nr:hypothetical protein [Lactococcus cremoris]TNU96709.1 hypothetical protein FIB47_10725 [Lactococcus cremoris]
MVLKLLAILPSGSAGKFLKKIWNLEKNLEFGKMGGDYAPPISAECQHGQQIPLSLRATRDTAINKKSTNRQQISQKMFIRNSCKYINKVI